MSQEFDPYYKWLGIPPKDQPPNHYRLLGLELFESDAEVIDAAASRLMEYLQGLSVGPHVAQSQALLNEIAAARLCLLDRKKKSAYDRKLKAEQVAAGPPKVSSQSRRQVRGTRGAAPPPPPDGPSGVLDIHVQPPRGSSSGIYPMRKKRPPWLIAGALSIVLLSLCGVGLYLALLSASEDGADGTGRVPAGRTGAKNNSKKTTKPTPRRPGGRSPRGPQGSHADPGFGLIEAAEFAVRQGEADEAIGHYETYLKLPGTSDDKEVKVKLDTLKEIKSDDYAMKYLAKKSDEELAKLHIGGQAKTDFPRELHAIFMKTLERNIPREWRRRHPDEFLKSQGLTPQGEAWLLDEKSAVVDVKRLQLLQDECQKADQKLAQQSKRVKRNASDEELFRNIDLREALQARAEIYSVFTLEFLKQQIPVALLQAGYARLAKDSNVNEALGRLTGMMPKRLGPSDAFLKSAKQLAQFTDRALADKVPYYYMELYGPRPMIKAIFNEAVACGVLLRDDKGSDINSQIPDSVAEQAGLRTISGGGRVILTEVDRNGKSREFTCPVVDVPILRIGRYTMSNLIFTATPKGVLSAPSLGAKEFGRFFEIDFDARTFDATVRPKKQPARDAKAANKTP